ncbi:MAG: hypothetical protein ACFB4I_07915 [Cyanophyceae cyanobacterium]
MRPGDTSLSSYSTGTVPTIPKEASSHPGIFRAWQISDPVVEPQGVYRLPNGQLVLSRQCS